MLTAGLRFTVANKPRHSIECLIIYTLLVRCINKIGVKNYYWKIKLNTVLCSNDIKRLLFWNSKKSKQQWAYITYENISQLRAVLSNSTNPFFCEKQINTCQTNTVILNLWNNQKKNEPGYISQVYLKFIEFGSSAFIWNANKNIPASITDSNGDKFCFSFSSPWNVKICNTFPFISNVQTLIIKLWFYLYRYYYPGWIKNMDTLC